MPFSFTAPVAQALVARAQALHASPAADTLLRGRHIAVMCDDPACPSALALEQAATALGARVSHIPHQTLSADNAAALRLLGRLYDAVDAVHLAPDEARRLQQAIGVPVLNGPDRTDATADTLLARLDPAQLPTAAAPQRLLQAYLLSVLGA